MFLKNNCTFHNTKVKLLNIVPLRKSWTQIIQIGHQENLTKIKNTKQIKSTHLYGNVRKKKKLLHFDPAVRVQLLSNGECFKFIFQIFQTKENMAQSESRKVKLDDAWKSLLISFYKENKMLLSNTGSKMKREKLKKLIELFDQRCDADFFGKIALCSSYYFLQK